MQGAGQQTNCSKKSADGKLQRKIMIIFSKPFGLISYQNDRKNLHTWPRTLKNIAYQNKYKVVCNIFKVNLYVIIFLVFSNEFQE